MYEVMIFSEKYLRSAVNVVPGSCVLVEGNLFFKNGDISMVAYKITSLLTLKNIKNKTGKDRARLGLTSKAASLWNN